MSRTTPTTDTAKRMDRETATDRLLAAKNRTDRTWDDLAGAVGRGRVWVAAAVFGDASCDETEAAALCDALDVSDPAVRAALQRPPTKGEADPSIPSDPMLYRLYEIPQVYGDAIKSVFHEEFGDAPEGDDSPAADRNSERSEYGIMSAIDFECHVERVEHPEGDRARIVYEGKYLPYKKW
jgi:cyanate lyase